jgi:hypothetical protein
VADFNGVVVPSEPIEATDAFDTKVSAIVPFTPDEDEVLGVFDSKSGVIVSPPVQAGLQRVTLRRALVSGAYVYFTGATPPGASDIVTIGETYV